jgi:hypothetical protein
MSEENNERVEFVEPDGDIDEPHLETDYVYCFRGAGWSKIGYASNVNRRLNQINNAKLPPGVVSVDFQWAVQCVGAKAIEGRIHDWLGDLAEADKRWKHEWYLLSDHAVVAIKLMVACMAAGHSLDDLLEDKILLPACVCDWELSK